MRLKPVNDQVVVVMGASSGIGRATALRFAAEGAKVVVSARSAEGLASLVAEIERRGGIALAVVADVTKPEEMKCVVERAVADFGRLDTWAHVAAVSVWGPFEATRPEEFQHIIDVNLIGQVNGARAALPHLRSNGGALVHVSSIAAKIPLPLASAYAASKHGVAGFVDTLRVELAREGAPVSVTQILPAGIDTPLFGHSLTRLGVAPRPAAPVYAPEIVAKAIVYAAAHPVRDLVVGGSGVGVLAVERISPSFVDQLMVGRLGFEAQLTGTPKSPYAPNNLFAPIRQGVYTVRGDFTDESSEDSLPTSIQETAVARVLARVARFGAKVGARAVNALYALRFRRSLHADEDVDSGRKHDPERRSGQSGNDPARHAP